MDKNKKWVPQAYLFDFEGTLVTFEWNLKKGVNTVLKQIKAIGYSNDLFGKNPTYVDIYRVASTIIEKENKSNVMNVVSNIFDHFDDDALSRWELYKDTKRTLRKLKDNDHTLGLVTNVGEKAIKSALKKLDLNNIFKIIITRNHVTRLKPNPEGLIIAANLLNTDPKSILFTGDSYDDLGAAKAANMKSCYLRGGQDKINSDDIIQPDFVIKNLDDLFNYNF
tara:strand:+ start:8142 stop:8810 length:669 start_codon:yes stop_codon:yes gene_type:complete